MRWVLVVQNEEGRTVVKPVWITVSLFVSIL